MGRSTEAAVEATLSAGSSEPRRTTRSVGRPRHPLPSGSAARMCRMARGRATWDRDRAAHRRLHARERVRAHEQLHRDRQDPRGAWASRGVRRGGLLARPSRAPRLRGGPRGSGSTGRGRPGRRAVLDRLHHGDGAGVPEADDRAARHVHPTGVGVADRRSEVLRAAAPGDPGPRAARRDRRGQRERLPGPPHPRRALGADHELQPARTEGSRHPADVQRLPDRRPERVGGVPRRVRPDPPRSLVRLQRLDARAGGTRPPRPRVHPRIGAPEPVRVPRCRRLSPCAAARIRVAPPRVIGP